MPRYVAFLRGVMPTNAKMLQLKRCFEEAGFTNVKTVLGSGNVVFDASGASEEAMRKKAETAMTKRLERTFPVVVRSVDALGKLIESDPYARFDLPSGTKRVVTFLREPCATRPSLPVELDGARVLAVHGREAFTVYIPGRGPVFMTLIEKTFGADVTTRTWETIRKCVAV